MKKKGIVLAVVFFFIMVSYSSTVEASVLNESVENTNCIIIGCTSNNNFFGGKPYLTNILEDIINPTMSRIYDLIKNEDLKILFMAMCVALELSMLIYIKMSPRQYKAKITFGSLAHTQPAWSYVPSEGWIITKGDNGVVSCSGEELYGHIGEIKTSYWGTFTILYVGVKNFTGFVIRIPLLYDYYVGYASEVKIGGCPWQSL